MPRYRESADVHFEGVLVNGKTILVCHKATRDRIDQKKQLELLQTDAVSPKPSSSVFV